MAVSFDHRIVMSRSFLRDETLARLTASVPAILPSLLASDFANLEREVAAVESLGVPALHLDIMDGHFVPNLSFGIPVVEAVRRVSRVPLDVHLMIANPDKYIDRFRKAGADTMTIHVEAVRDPRPMLDRIRSLGAAAGLAFNPPTPFSQVESYLPHCDIVLAMSVMPGFGGQEFEPSTLDKLRALKAHPKCQALLEVDGGVDVETVAECAQAGAELFVAGTAVFREPDYSVAIQNLRSRASFGNN
jgi:ribulose-phosphate 3-epimerase